MTDSAERTGQLPGDLLLALSDTILPLPKADVSDLATFDETEYEFLDIEEERKVLVALGSVTERKIQPEVNENDTINFAMRVDLAREVAKGRTKPGAVSVMSPMEEAIIIAESSIAASTKKLYKMWYNTFVLFAIQAGCDANLFNFTHEIVVLFLLSVF